MPGLAERLAPIVAVIVASVAGVVGLIPPGVQFAVFTGAIGYVLGLYRMAAIGAEQMRASAVEQVEKAIATGHTILDRDDPDDRLRQRIEGDLTELAGLLAKLDASAPRHVRRRQRKAAP
jgi:hypothetical protein